MFARLFRRTPPDSQPRQHREVRVDQQEWTMQDETHPAPSEEQADQHRRRRRTTNRGDGVDQWQVTARRMPSVSSNLTPSFPSPDSPPEEGESGSENVRTVARLLRLVAALEGERSLERGRPISLFAALALREVDALVERMSYEELLEAFQGKEAAEGLSPHEINAILPRTLTKADMGHSSKTQSETGVEEEEGRCCPICLDTFTVGCSVKEFPGCKHVFDADCLDAWLKRKASCPCCRCKAVPAI